MTSKPLVSCLCVSYNRPHYLAMAIAYFLGQVYEHKELIVVSKIREPEYEAIIARSGSGLVSYHVLEGAGEITLGELRNFAIGQSNGEYICVWDDDDWHHCERVSDQVESAIRNGKEGSVLPYCLLFNAVTKESFLSQVILHPASILCRKSILTGGMLYPSLNAGEDSVFLNKLFRNNVLYPLIKPVLYIYVYHGSNSVSENHFNRFQGQKFSESLNGLVVDVMEGKYSYEIGSGLLSGRDVSAELDYFGYLLKKE